MRKLGREFKKLLNVPKLVSDRPIT